MSILGNVIKPGCYDQLRVQFCKRTQRNIEKLSKLAGVLPGLPFGYI